MVEKRLTSISSSKTEFDEAIPTYNQALGKSGYRTFLNFEDNTCRMEETRPKTFANENQEQPSLSEETMQKTVINTSEKNGQQSSQKEQTTSQQRKKRKNRRRRTFWYNPPFNKAVKTNVGKTFLKLIDKHFGHEREEL